MKAATGELNLTLITVIAVGAILALAFVFKDQLANMIQNMFNTQSGQQQNY